MLAEPSAPTVGQNHKRQLRPCDGTILHARQFFIDGRRNAADRYLLGSHAHGYEMTLPASDRNQEAECRLRRPEKPHNKV
jgi:hypothetical protein